MWVCTIFHPPALVFALARILGSVSVASVLSAQRKGLSQRLARVIITPTSGAERVPRLREQIERASHARGRDLGSGVQPALPSAPHASLVWIGLAALLASLAGCTSWSRLPDSRPVPAQGTVQVWSGGQAMLLREARTVDDSLVGRDAAPDTTRRSVSLASIDSVRAQTVDMGKVLIVGTGVAIGLLLAFASGFESE